MIAKTCWSTNFSLDPHHLQCSSRPEMQLTSWPLESRWDVWPAMTNGIRGCDFVSVLNCLSGGLTLFCSSILEPWDACWTRNPRQKAWLSQLMTFLSLSPPNMQEGPAIERWALLWTNMNVWIWQRPEKPSTYGPQYISNRPCYFKPWS